jgi:hypothetical protein
MAKAIITQPTLFWRLRRIRATVRAAVAEVETLRDSMDRQSKPHPKTRWEPAEDLHIQLGQWLEAFDMALDLLKPTRFHVDQPARREAREAAHG